MVLFNTVSVPDPVADPAAAASIRFCDGAVFDRHPAVVADAAPLVIVDREGVDRQRREYRVPMPSPKLPEMVSPESMTAAHGPTEITCWKTWSPLIVRSPGPGPSITIGPDGSPKPSPMVIDCGVAKTVGSNSMMLPARLVLASAWLMQ